MKRSILALLICFSAISFVTSAWGAQPQLPLIWNQSSWGNTVWPIDSDTDGIDDTWEQDTFGNLTDANATSDFDGDGVSDLNEFLYDLKPLVPFQKEQLIAYYNFRDNAKDKSGYNFDGIINGPILTVDRFGNADSAYSFNINGSNAFIQAGDNQEISQNTVNFYGDLTLSLWVKENTQNPQGAALLAKRGPGSRDGWYLGINASGAPFFQIANGSDPAITSTHILDSGWHHIGVSYSDTNQKALLFFDGAADGNATDIPNTNVLDIFHIVDLFIGKDSSGSGNDHFFLGSLDDIHIYNRVLSPVEITALYNAPNPKLTGPYIITPSSDPIYGGIISPNTPQTASYGEISSFRLFHRPGFPTIHVKGTCRGTLVNDSFNTDPISEDCTVEADFSRCPAGMYGEGEYNIPCKITSCAQLQAMKNDLQLHYEFANDIDCSDTVNWNNGAGFEPIGTISTPFIGALSGRNHIINKLTINRPIADYIGLFGVSQSLGSYDLGLTNAQVIGHDFVGILAGRVTNFVGQIFTTGSVTGHSNVGGLLGAITWDLVLNSYSDANVTGSGDYTGGLIGKSSYSHLDSVYASSQVKGQDFVGGLIGGAFGNADAPVTLTNSFASSIVSGQGSNIGGLLGAKINEDPGITPPSHLWAQNYYNNHSGNPAECVGNVPDDCTAINNDRYYFYDINNTPVKQWWPDIWALAACNTKGYPRLAFENITNPNACYRDQALIIYDASSGNAPDQQGWTLYNTAGGSAHSITNGALHIGPTTTGTLYYWHRNDKKFDFLSGFEINVDLKVISSPYSPASGGRAAVHFGATDQNGLGFHAWISDNKITFTNPDGDLFLGEYIFTSTDAFHHYRVIVKNTTTDGPWAELLLDDQDTAYFTFPLLPFPTTNLNRLNRVSFGNGATEIGGEAEFRTISYLPSLPVFGITAISPDRGLENSSTTTTVSGAGFGLNQGKGRLLFDGANATITSWSNHEIIGNTPVHAQGSADVSVINDAGNNATITNGFTYLALYNVTFTPGTYGIIDGNSTQLVLTGDNSTSVTAIAEINYAFTAWSGDYSGKTNPLVIKNINKPMTVTANFGPDTDGDGVADSLDKCPNDPDKILQGQCGCGVADLDSDADSFADCIDPFPNDANYHLDVDGDGIADEWEINYLGHTYALDSSSDYDGDGISDLDEFINGLNPNSNFSQNGLIAFYPFTGNANDASGNGHNGTPVNGISLAENRAGMPNNAYSFDGVDDSINLGTWFNYQSFSLSFWLKAGISQTTYADIIDNNHRTSTNWVIQQIYRTTNSYQAITGNVSSFTLESRWQHLVVVQDAATGTRVFLDGLLVQENSTPDSRNYDGSQYLRLGTWGGGGRNWHGIMDDVRMYNRPLSNIEAQTLYNHTDPPAHYLVTPVTQPHGTISPAAPQTSVNNEPLSFAIIPDPGFKILQVSGCNGALADTTYTIGTITTDCQIEASFITTNNLPIIAEGSAITVTMSEDGLPTPFALDLHGSDADNETITWSINTPASHGTASVQGTGTVKSIAYIPVANWDSTDSFSIMAADTQGGNATITVHVELIPFNDPPQITAQTTLSILEDTPLILQSNAITVYDPDNSYPADFTITPGTGLSYTLSGNTITPAPNFSGELSVAVLVYDGTTDSNTFTLSISVIAVNDLPMAVNDSYNIAEGGTLNRNAVNGLLINDTDQDGDSLTATLRTHPVNGVISLYPDGSFTYVHNGNELSTDTFTYYANDRVSRQWGTVTINISQVNDPPIALDDYFNGETNALISGNVITNNDSDPDGDPVTLDTALIKGVENGTLSVGPNGNFTYQAGSQPVVDTFTYRISDGLLSDTATATITIKSPNLPPIAHNDSFTVEKLHEISGNVCTNDTDPESKNISLGSITSSVTHGLLNWINCNFTYTHTDNSTLADSFSYLAFDGEDTSLIPAQVTIKVIPYNQVPTAANDNDPRLYRLHEGGVLTIDPPGILTNDNDPENIPLTALFNSGPSSGILTLNANGSFTYQHNGSETSSDSFTYKASDGIKQSAPATVTLKIEPVNDPPTANNDAISIRQGDTLTYAAPGVLENDSDPEGSPLSALIFSQPTHGSLTFQNDGGFTYISDNSSLSDDLFTYHAKDNSNLLSLQPGVVTIHIIPANTLPIAKNDTITVLEGGTTTITNGGSTNLTANDIDSDGDTLTARKVSNPGHGSVTLSSDGTFSYHHDGSETTTDSFNYTVNDGTGESNSAQVHVTITPVNDPPVVRSDSYSVGVGKFLIVGHPGVLANDFDNEKTALTANLLSTSNGSLTLNDDGSFTYQASGTAGVDNFIYTASDGITTTQGGVTITITANNPAPIFTLFPTNLSIGEDNTTGPITFTVTDDSPITIHGSSSNTALVPTSNIIISGTKPDYTITITPKANQVGETTITLTANDGESLVSNSFLLTIIPTNDPPVIRSNRQLTVGSSATSTITSSYLEGYDIDGDTPLIFTITGVPTAGDVKLDNTPLPLNGTFNQSNINAGLVTFNSNIDGPDFFTFTLSDGNTSTAAATFIVDVNLNTAPAANNSSNNNLVEDNTLNGQVTGSDAENDPLTFILDNRPRNGRVLLNPASGNFTYTPDINYNGIDSFTFMVSDGDKLSTPATVTLSIKAVNDAPTAFDRTYRTTENTPVPIKLPAADIVEGSPLTFHHGEPGHGRVNGSSNNLIYIPEQSWQGIDHFTFSANDGVTNSDNATITIEVSGSAVINNIPTAYDTALTTTEDTQVSGILQAVDHDGTPLTYSLVQAGKNGSTTTITNAGTGAFTYTPAPNDTGLDTFTFKVTDGQDSSNIATITIAITKVNDPPMISGTPANTVNINSPYSFTPTASDPDEDPLVFSATGLPSWASLDSQTGIIYSDNSTNNTGTTYGITLSVSDSHVSRSLAPFNISVLGSTPETIARPGKGTYNKPQNVTLSCYSSDNCTIYYTLDGTTPTSASPSGINNVGPLSINTDTVLKYYASTGTLHESIKISSYLIDTTPPTASVTSPLADTVLTSGIALITGTADDLESGLKSVEIQITDGKDYLIIENGTGRFVQRAVWLPVSVNMGDSTWSFPLPPSFTLSPGSYRIIVKAVDQAKNERITAMNFWFGSQGDQDYTELHLRLSSPAIKKDDSIDISGTFKRYPDGGASLAGVEINVAIKDSQGTNIADYTGITDADGIFTLTGINVFEFKDTYSITASFNATLAMSACSSTASLLVGSSAGYVVLVEGKITNEEGLNSHNLTANRIYAQLINRGFQANNIIYLNHNTGQSGVDGSPGKTALKNAITTDLKAKLNGSPAPFYLIMVDHGDVDTFYLNGDNITVTPFDLNIWLTELESNLNAEAYAEPRVVVLGSCYSGSFINILSGRNRVIISSAAANEESYKGPLEGYENINNTILPIRVGEYFMEEFFNELGQGISLANSFNNATSRTEIFTRRSGTTIDNRYFDTAAQHPLLDDNGDGKGTNDLTSDSGDGNSTKTMFLGIASGASLQNKASELGFPVTGTLYLAAGQTLTSATLWAEASGQLPAAWIEIRRPAAILTWQQSTGQLTNDMEKVSMTYNSGTNRWEAVYNGFNEPGKYEIFYFLRNQSGALLAMQSSLVYRNRDHNTPPKTFDLISPDPDILSIQKTVLTFDWRDAVDPERDHLSYTLIIADDPYFKQIVYRKRELAHSSTYVDQKANLTNLSRYYWQVEAVDSYGALASSRQIGSFTTLNTGTLPGIVNGVLFDKTTWQRINGASVQSGIHKVTAENDGYFVMALSPLTKSLSASAGGYNDLNSHPVNLTSARVTTLNIALTANGMTANSTAYNGHEDIIITHPLIGSNVSHFEIMSQGQLGTVTMASDNVTFTYTPSPDTYGSDRFTFRGYDPTSGNQTDIATIDLTITPENDAPVLDPAQLINFSAINQSAANNSGSLIQDLLDLAITDPDTGAEKGMAIMQTNNLGIGVWQYTLDAGTIWLDIQNGSNPTLLPLAGTSRIRFRPSHSGTGRPTITIKAWDQTENIYTNTSTAFSRVSGSLSIDIQTVNSLPTSHNLSFSLPEDDFLIDQLSASDKDHDPLSYRIISNTGHGQLNMVAAGAGIFSYDPALNFAGNDSFTFRVSDGRNYSNTATVNLTVTPINDPPQSFGSQISAYAKTPVAIKLRGSDVDSDTLTYTVVQSPQFGHLTNNGGSPNLIYNADNNTRSDFFIFTVGDGLLTSPPAQVNISVAAQPNRTPSATVTENSFTTIEDTPFRGTLTASDPDNDPLIYRLVSSASKGTVEILNAGTGAFRYTPFPNEYGMDSFYFKAVDPGRASATSIAKITITGTDDPPVISGIPEHIARANTPYSFTPIANDSDGDILTFTAKNLPHWQTISFDSNTGKISGTPLSGEAGVSRGVSITVSDGSHTAALAPFDLVTSGDSNAPVTLASIPAGIYNHTIEVNLFCFDTDGNCTIYYSDNNTTPTTSSPSGVNTVGPIGISQTTTLKYFAVDSTTSHNQETLRSSSYTIDTIAPAVSIDTPLNDSTLSKLDWLNIDADDMDSDIAAIELQISDGTSYYNGENFSSTPAWVTASYSNAIGMWTYQTAKTAWSDNTTYSVIAKATDLAGNSAIDTVLFSYSSGPVKQAYTTLFLEAASQSLIVNDQLNLSGKLTRLPDTNMSLSQRQVKLTIIRPDNSELSPTFAETYDQFGHFTFKNIKGFDRRGQFTLRVDFSATPLLTASSSTIDVQVASGAGYVILLQGEGSSDQDENDHFLNTSRIYSILKNRGISADDILLLSPETGHSGWDGLANKTTLENALKAWLPGKMSISAAPIFLIMTGDATNNNFTLNTPEKITASELNNWFSAMENSLSANAALENRSIIIGASNSGSFIPQLSEKGRTIITSTAASEQASRGPQERDPLDATDKNSSDFFMENLFKELGHGYSFLNSFEHARDLIDQTRRGTGWQHGSGTAFMDNSVQHPLLDDNGDGSGSNDIYSGKSEGIKAAKIFLGTGTTFDTNSAMNPAELTAVTETSFLSSDKTNTLLWAKVKDNNQVRTIWCELRTPSQILQSTPLADQAASQFKRFFLTYNPAANRFETKITDLSESGKYEVFYYVTDLNTGNLSTLHRSIIYKNREANSTPLPFALQSPMNNATTQTVLTFRWDKTRDGDNDTLTYTLIIAADPNFSYEVYRSKDLQYPYAMVGESANLKDLSHYYWKVQAIDEFGAVQESQSREFSTDNTNAEPPGILEIMMISSLDWSLISGAQAINAMNQSILAAVDELSSTDLAAGSYTITGSALGYTNPPPTNAEISSGKVTRIILEMDTNLAASNLRIRTDEDTPVSSYLIANSTKVLTFSIITNGSMGHADLNNSSTGAFTYTPNKDIFGNDNFSFTAIAADGSSDNGTITVIIKQILLGDINGNGQVDLQDAILGVRLATRQNIHEKVSLAADINGDHLINMIDAVFIIRQLGR